MNNLIVQQKQKREKAKSTPKAWVWTHDETMRLWASEEVLYKSSHADYRDKTKKQNAIERISIAMDTEESPAPSAHDISLKITNLKTYYCSTKAKYESAMKSGAGVDDIHRLLHTRTGKVKSNC